MAVLIQTSLVLLCLGLGCSMAYYKACTLSMHRCPRYTAPVVGSVLAFSSRAENPDDMAHRYIISLLSRGFGRVRLEVMDGSLQVPMSFFSQAVK